MGINAELVKLAAQLRRSNILQGDSVIELGAQDVCVVDGVIRKTLSDFAFDNLPGSAIDDARQLYACLGFAHYHCIDASGERGALVFDLNEDLRSRYSYNEKFDLVTNLGTAEHCFDQRAVFKNIHDLCKPGGIVIHALPAQGNVNHAFYNYHPRFFADLGAANAYELVDLSFTVDYKPTLFKFSKDQFQQWDSHDILLYATFRKTRDSEFSLPFDGMFASQSQLDGYLDLGIDPLSTEFAPYLKGGNWDNTKGIVQDLPVVQEGRVPAFFRRLFSKSR